MCARRRRDLQLTGTICAIHRRSRDTYGSPSIHAELADDHGIRVGRKRVARLMRQNGLRGATLRKYVVTTQSDPQAAKPIDLVERRFFADAPDQLWVADLTCIPTWLGWLYLAMVMDVYSRKIVGWARRHPPLGFLNGVHEQCEKAFAPTGLQVDVNFQISSAHHSRFPVATWAVSQPSTSRWSASFC